MTRHAMLTPNFQFQNQSISIINDFSKDKFRIYVLDRFKDEIILERK